MERYIVKKHLMSNETIWLPVGISFVLVLFMKSFELLRECFDFHSGANILAEYLESL